MLCKVTDDVRTSVLQRPAPNLPDASPDTMPHTVAIHGLRSHHVSPHGGSPAVLCTSSTLPRVRGPRPRGCPGGHTSSNLPKFSELVPSSSASSSPEPGMGPAGFSDHSGSLSPWVFSSPPGEGTLIPEKSTRLCHPQVCHFGIRIILS